MVSLKTRLINTSALFYLLYVLAVAGTTTFLATRPFHLTQTTEILRGYSGALFILFIISLVVFRGMIVRVRYSFFIGVFTLVTTVVLIIPVISLSVTTIPLLVISLVSLVALIRRYEYYNFPTRLFDRPEISISIVIIVIVLLIGVIGTMLLGNQFSPKITDFPRALYYTGEVVTTLGFGDILPITRTSQIFSIAMSILGIGSFFGAVTVIVGPLIYERGRRVVRVIQRIESKMMDNYVLFIDFSPLLVPLLEELVKKDELVIVLIDEKSKEGMIDAKNVFVEIDQDIDKLILHFDLGKSKRIVLGSSEDSRNIMNALYLLSLYPGEDLKAKIISLVNVSTNVSRLKSLTGELISPADLVVEHSMSLFLSGNLK
jgi:hypothetical protein